jgi:hypothetical protein
MGTKCLPCRVAAEVLYPQQQNEDRTSAQLDGHGTICCEIKGVANVPRCQRTLSPIFVGADKTECRTPKAVFYQDRICFSQASSMACACTFQAVSVAMMHDGPEHDAYACFTGLAFHGNWRSQTSTTTSTTASNNTVIILDMERLDTDPSLHSSFKLMST